MRTLTLGHKDGDIYIREDELPTITDEQLQWVGITREDLHRCFAEGAKLMEGVKPGERVRPVADQHLDGTWEVLLVGYSPNTDPLMHGPNIGLGVSAELLPPIVALKAIMASPSHRTAGSSSP